jgi:glycerol-3-phosphate acyltransferase PlsX
MGGDHAPAEIVAGGVDASRKGVDVVLVGDPDPIHHELEALGADLPVVPASEVVGMGDDPSRALREKPDSSIMVAARLVADGKADGFLSAGSTGAAMAAAAIILGRVPGVSRPPLVTFLPTSGSPTAVLDMGANPDVKPEQLLQFAVMGSIAATTLLGIDNPRVALLSNGEEKGKGRDLERAAYDLLEAGPVNFVGNVEGRDVAGNRADVIVTDGFTGNVFLKTLEGTAQLIASYLAQEIAPLDLETQRAIVPVLERVRQRMDYESYGGALLLGVKGVAVVSHGSSTRMSIANALSMAMEGAEKGLAARVAADIAAL